MFSQNLLMSLSAEAKVWAVFAACLISSAVGVAISLAVFGSTVTGFKSWGIGLVISVVMLGISYGAKYANDDARRTFTPVDLIQYLSQGFLWPSTWPALADVVGIQVIEPAETSARLIESVQQILASIVSIG